MPYLATWADWAQVISIPIAVVSIIVSVILYRRSRQRRALSCRFEPVKFPLEVRTGPALDGDIEIRYKGQPIYNLFLVRARLKNTGNMPIYHAQIFEPITFEFRPEVKLIQAPKITDKKPKNLKIDWSFSQARSVAGQLLKASVNLDLFNPGDEFTVEFLCTGKVTAPRVTQRIEGVKRMEFLDPKGLDLRNQAIRGTLYFFASIMILGSLLGLSLLPMTLDQQAQCAWWLRCSEEVTPGITVKVAPTRDPVFEMVIVILSVLGILAVAWPLFLNPVIQWIQYRKRQGMPNDSL